MRNLLLCFSLSLVLSSCGIITRAIHYAPDIAAIITAALEAWKQRGLPAPTAERCDFSHVEIRHGDLSKLCGPAVSNELHFACLSWDSSNGVRQKQFPVANMRPDVQIDENGEPLIHELMHAMWDCAGLPISPANLNHQDPRVWAGAGGLSAAQSIAEQLYKASK